MLHRVTQVIHNITHRHITHSYEHTFTWTHIVTFILCHHTHTITLRCFVSTTDPPRPATIQIIQKVKHLNLSLTS